jgi:hypothetical protein
LVASSEREARAAIGLDRSARTRPVFSMTTTKTCGRGAGEVDGDAVAVGATVADSAVWAVWGAPDAEGTAATCPGVHAASTRNSAAADRPRTFTFPRT